MTPIVEIDKLYFSYPGNRVLTDINLRLFPGEFVAIIGPNGGGKTTLLKLILGLLKPSAGVLHVFGQAPCLGNVNERLPISYVPQAMRYDKLFPISVLEVVLGGTLFKLPWYGRFHQNEVHAALKAIDQVGLKGFQDRSFGTLSGGQAQRVLIARALVSNPDLLLLDEPTASVDTKAESDIYALLKELKGKMTILMITHDLRAVIENVEKIFCIQGSLVELNPEQICKHFALGLYHPPVSALEKE